MTRTVQLREFERSVRPPRNLLTEDPEEHQQRNELLDRLSARLRHR